MKIFINSSNLSIENFFSSKDLNKSLINLDSIEVSVPVSNEITLRVKAIRERFDEISRDWDTLQLHDSNAPRRKKLDTLVGHRPVAPVAPKGLYLYGNVGSGKLPDSCTCSKEAISSLTGSILSISFFSWPKNAG